MRIDLEGLDWWLIVQGGSETAAEGRLLRFDTLQASAGAPANFWAQQGLAADGWAAFEMGPGLHADCQRFSGAVYDGARYVYFAPAGHTKIVRYDRRHSGGFTSAGTSLSCGRIVWSCLLQGLNCVVVLWGCSGVHLRRRGRAASVRGVPVRRW